jgi:hypothetical protein
MAAPRKIDWDRIEPAYRANIKSLTQIAVDYEKETGVAVTHAAIIKHFKKVGIRRDLKEKIRAKADSIVLGSMVTGKVTAKVTASDIDMMEAEAETMATVRLAHRLDITKRRAQANKLFQEVEEQNEKKELSLQARIKCFSDMTNAYKILIGLERQAYGIEDKAVQATITVANIPQYIQDIIDEQ